PLPGHVPRAKAPGLASVATPLGPDTLLRFQKPSPSTQRHPGRTTRRHEKLGYSSPPAGVQPHKLWLGSLYPRRPGGFPAFATALRKQTQEGCAFPVQPTLPSQVRRCRAQTLTHVPLASGVLHLVVPRYAAACQTGLCAKAPEGSPLGCART